MKNFSVRQRGFTLIEILIVIGIIAILAAVVIVAINPARNFAQANNTVRNTDVVKIIDAIGQYQVDNKGKLPTSITTTMTEICATGASSCTNLIDLSVLTNNETYLTSLPKDPLCPDECATNGIGYRVKKNANGRVTVDAPDAELSQVIEITR